MYEPNVSIASPYMDGLPPLPTKETYSCDNPWLSNTLSTLDHSSLFHDHMITIYSLFFPHSFIDFLVHSLMHAFINHQLGTKPKLSAQIQCRAVMQIHTCVVSFFCCAHRPAKDSAVERVGMFFH